MFSDVVHYGFIEQVATVAVLGFGNLIELGDLLSWNPEAYGSQITHIAREYAVLHGDANATARSFFVPIRLNYRTGNGHITGDGVRNSPDQFVRVFRSVEFLQIDAIICRWIRLCI
jgi:hypothetical protein